MQSLTVKESLILCLHPIWEVSVRGFMLQTKASVFFFVGRFVSLFVRFFRFPLKALWGRFVLQTCHPNIGNGRNTVSRVLFRKRELTEFCRKLGEFWEKLGEFALAHK